MRLLDLCCCGGIGAIGYKLAASNIEIVGVDIVDMSTWYPFEFIKASAFELSYEFLDTFDFIHISPPCQAYSKATPAKYRDNHPRLISNAIRLGYASGKPFVVENVPGSSIELRPTFALVAGSKTRYFHANFPVNSVKFDNVLSIMSSSYSSTRAIARSWGVPDEYRVLRKHLRQGIPPLMTRHILESYLEYAG